VGSASLIFGGRMTSLRKVPLISTLSDCAATRSAGFSTPTQNPWAAWQMTP
jgi:hypothetical protein